MLLPLGIRAYGDFSLYDSLACDKLGSFCVFPTVHFFSDKLL